MFVGETGVGRTIQATLEAMNAAGRTDPDDVQNVRDLGVIDLPTIQKKLNLHYTLSLDLFGQEVSDQRGQRVQRGHQGPLHGAADRRRSPPAGRHLHGPQRRRRIDRGARSVPALTAINMRLRDDYVRDAAGGVGRWNKAIAKAGIDFELTLPHEAFHRQIGVFSAIAADPEGNLISEAEWEANRDRWLPTRADGEYIESLMKPCYEPGEYASWIAPPKVGIDNKPGDFEYVKLHMA